MSESCYNLKWLKITILVTALIFVFAHLPREIMSSILLKGGIDKLEHVLAYGVITFLFLISIRTSLTIRSSLLLFLVVPVFGVFDELTQTFVRRTPSVADLIADFVGVLCVLILSIIRRHWFLRRI
jgi:VanZ family protein